MRPVPRTRREPREDSSGEPAQAAAVWAPYHEQPTSRRSCFDIRSDYLHVPFLMLDRLNCADCSVFRYTEIYLSTTTATAIITDDEVRHLMATRTRMLSSAVRAASRGLHEAVSEVFHLVSVSKLLGVDSVLISRGRWRTATARQGTGMWLLYCFIWNYGALVEWNGRPGRELGT